jgi:signal transduction histidine kinase
MVLMRLHELMPRPGWDKGRPKLKPGDNPFDAVESAAKEALAEIRNVATGLSLPQLENRSTVEVVKSAILNHERRTRSEVGSHIGDVPTSLPLPHKICLYRCTQEGLSNAYRHAGAKEQFVTLVMVANRLVLTVSDAGAGFFPANGQYHDQRLGLAGLRNRVEALEGEFELQSQPGHGTTLKISLPMVSVS